MRYLWLVGTLLLGCGGPENPAESAPVIQGRPNILVVTIDTTRADHLGCYGYFRDTSPNIDALAEESLVYERCIVPMATTLPTHTSLFTGTYPIEHGVTANLDQQHVYERDPGLATMAEFLRAQGYDTGAFVSALPLRAKAGLSAGFEIYSYSRRKLRRGNKTVDSARTWLEERATEPFFLWLHLFDPHGPYDPPAPYDERFQTGDGILEWMAERDIELEGVQLGEPIQVPEVMNAYDGEIAFMDEQLGLLFDDLRERGLWEDMVVVLMGDHGEGLNQHGLAAHGRVFNEQLHAPLMLRMPGLKPGRHGGPVSAVDVLPTVFGRLDLPGQRDFLAQATGIDRLGSPDAGSPAVWSQSSPRQSEDGGIEYALTGPRWKYLRGWDGVEHLYDLRADPHELHDLAGEEPEILAEFASRTDAWLARQEAAAGGEKREATAAELEGLQSLGYGGGDEDE